MTKRFAAASALLGCVALACAAPVEAKDFTYTTWVAPAETTVIAGMAPFFKRVEAETGGEISAKIFTAGQLAGQPATLTAVRDRVADSGFVLEGVTPKETPVNALTADFQFLNLDPMVAVIAKMELSLFKCPECQAEYKKYNVFNLGGHSIDNNFLMCTRELKSMDDIAKLRIRAPLRAYRDVTTWFGATPVYTTFPEMVPALQTGQAHCTIGNTSWMTAYGLKDMMKSIVTARYIGALPCHATFTVNRDAWKELSPKVKQAVLRNLPKMMIDATAYNSQQGKTGLEAGLASGVKVVDLGPAFTKKWDEFIAGEPERIIKAAEASGVKRDVAQRLLADYGQLYKKWEAIVKAAGGDNDKLGKSIWEQIYSKVNP
ncbi:MAG: TRAP transporter substrate-binding protein DctP [Alphaproteobacteria bacterium]|nr:TRAP transporter substrate-binding protein DctP [Alphaproteobacteria bacterium]